MIETIILLPFLLFKWIFSLAVWGGLIGFAVFWLGEKFNL